MNWQGQKAPRWKSITVAFDEKNDKHDKWNLQQQFSKWVPSNITPVHAPWGEEKKSPGPVPLKAFRTEKSQVHTHGAYQHRHIDCGINANEPNEILIFPAVNFLGALNKY